jgi:anaerobic selenocysteine-containing dehydrogenase
MSERARGVSAHATRLTTCALDCWDACSIRVTVDGERAVRLDGNPDHPTTGTFLCARTNRYLERVYSPLRITRPLRRPRRGARPEPISWDSALDELAGRLHSLRAACRPEAVLHVQSAGSMAVQKKISERFFSLYGGATRLVGDFCLGAGKFALTRCYGDYRPHDWGDLVHARLILLWGRDPFIAGPHLLPILRSCRAAGARIISVNPIRIGPPGTDGSRLVDRHLQIMPGGDASLARALARRVLAAAGEDRAFLAARAAGWERFRDGLESLDDGALVHDAGLPAAEIEALAADLLDRRPFAILLGTGVGHTTTGVEAIESIAALSALCGMAGKPGGGLTYSLRHGRDLDGAWRTPNPKARLREVVVSDFPRRLPSLEPAIEMAWLAGANPAAMLPDSASVRASLEAIPFVVAVDFHHTSTTDLADLILPVTSFLEEDGLVPSWGHAFLGSQRAVIPAVGEAKSDLEIWQELAARLGFGSAMAGSGAEWGRRAFGDRLRSEDHETLATRGFVRNPVHEAVPWADGLFATPSGRFQFPEVADTFHRPRPDARHPFILLTPKARDQHLSQEVGGRARLLREVSLHPEAMRRAGIEAGRTVTLRSGGHAISAVARADASLRPEVAVLPLSGRPEAGTGVNLLTTARLASDGVTPAYNDCFVTISPAGRRSPEGTSTDPGPPTRS